MATGSVPDEAGLQALARRVQGSCLGAGFTLAAAESCTGGLIGHVLTEVPGSSAYFRGSIVAYADEVKARLLGVKAELLERHGAVSAQVARAMASGARERFATDIAVSVTGIAGPDGGSESKPVGLTYLAVDGPHGSDVRRVVWDGDRSANKRASAAAALDLVLAAIDTRAMT